MVLKVITRFASDESGAVTVDWVVLTGAIVGLAFAVFSVITRESLSVGANVVSDTVIAASEYGRNVGADDDIPEPEDNVLPD